MGYPYAMQPSSSRHHPDHPHRYPLAAVAPPPLTPFAHVAHLDQQYYPQHPQPVWYPANDSYLFGSPFIQSGNDLLSSLSRWTLSPPDFLPALHHNAGFMPTQHHGSADLGFSPAPSDSSSVLSCETEASPALAHAPTHVVCNAPLVAPVPLPYHSPTFLQYDDLPDDDEDLSHPPYTRRPHKRKREEDEASGSTGSHDTSAAVPAKRRSISGLDSQPYAYRAPPLPLPPRRLSMPASSLRHGRTR